MVYTYTTWYVMGKINKNEEFMGKNISFLKLEEVCEKLKISRSALYGNVSKKKIPPGVKVGASLRWLEYEIEEWMMAVSVGVSGDDLIRYVADMMKRRENKVLLPGG